MLKNLLSVEDMAAFYKLFGYSVVAVRVGSEEQICVVHTTRNFLHHVEVKVGDRRESMVLNSHSRYRYRWL